MSSISSELSAQKSGQPLKIMLCAVEPSGDALGAALMKSLRQNASSEISFFGCGGPLMAKEGLDSAFSIDVFSIIGPTGGLRALPAALKHSNELARIAARGNIDAAVLIDGWAFSKMATARIRSKSPNTKLYKFVGPQLWASRPGRIHDVKRLFDGVLTLFEFENSYYESEDIPVICTGNPIFQKAASIKGDANRFRAVHDLGEAPLLAVLIGSRRGELKRHVKPFRETAELLVKRFPDLRLTVPLAPNIAREARAVMSDWPGAPIFVEADERYHAFAAADVALAASGTVTTELAIQKTPMVVAYKVDFLTAMWIRAVITTPYVSLINAAAGRAVVPEFLQENCSPDALARALADLLDNPDARKAQLEAFPDLLAQLGAGGPPASEIGATAILNWLAERKT